MKKYITILFCLVAGICFSQARVEQLNKAMEYKNRYPEKDAVVLSSKATYSFTIEGVDKLTATLANEENVFYLKDNVSYSNVVFYDEQSEVSGSRVENHKGKKLVSTDSYTTTRKYESNGIFHSDAMLYVFGPRTTVLGETNKFFYSKKFLDTKYLTNAYFHGNYPIEQKEIIVKVPQWLEMDIIEFNFEGYQIEKKDSVTKTGVTYKIYRAKNLHELKREEGAPSASKNFPHLIFVFKSYTRNTKKINLFQNTTDLYSWYNGLCKEIGNDCQNLLQPIVTRLTEGKKNDEEKIEAIFYWVQENIRYIAFENGIMGFKPEPAQKVYNNKYGDCKGKANLLKEMLTLAGYDARLTWIGTNDIPYDYSIPSLAVDNHMICTVIHNEKKYFLDGTEEYIAINDYAARIQGRPVMVQDGDKFFLDKIPSFDNTRNKVQAEIKLSVNETSLKGTAKYVYNGEEKIEILRGYSSIKNPKKEEALKEFLNSGDKNLKVSNIKTSDLNSRQQPLSLEYDFSIDNQITESGSEKYFNIDSEKSLINFDFDSTRMNDYEFGHKILWETNIELLIPAGYKVDYIPADVLRKNANFSFDISFEKKEDKIIYKKIISIPNGIVRTEDFKEWNSSIKELKKVYNDQIVLIKL